MMRVCQAPEPATFDQKVRQPGLLAIAELAGQAPDVPRLAGRPFAQVATDRSEIRPDKFPDYWTRVLDELMEAYHEICAFCCFRIHPVTGGRSADHFVPKSRDWRAVYEWSNLRLCSTSINGRKWNNADMLDPFEIGEGWFQLELVGFQVMPNPALPAETRRAVDRTIQRLGLNASTLCKAREEDAENYWTGDVTERILDRESPFVAAELRRQNRLNVW